MTLKSLIQRLLDSRTTPEEASNSVTPNLNGLVSIAAPGDYVCPTDGYVKVYAKTSDSEHCELKLYSTAVCNSDCSYGMAESGSSLTVFAKKGETVNIVLNKMKDATATFFPTTGGGYQTLNDALLQGGGICLNSLSSSLRRSSLSVRRSGLVISRIAEADISSFLLHTGPSLCIRLPLTGFCTLTVRIVRPLILSTTAILCALISLENRLRLLRDSFRYQKVKQQDTYLLERQPSKTKLGSSRLLVLPHRNFVGGASC